MGPSEGIMVYEERFTKLKIEENRNVTILKKKFNKGKRNTQKCVL